MPTIAIAPSDGFYDKTLSNIHEILARGGDVMLLTDKRGTQSVHSAVRVLTLPDTTFLTSPFIYLIPIQFFSYYVAVFKGTDVDQPRNLAKSVTVE
jgi:glucosamine--fructose-6-phosphate aminotransferase (isomerizing)